MFLNAFCRFAKSILRKDYLEASLSIRVAPGKKISFRVKRIFYSDTDASAAGAAAGAAAADAASAAAFVFTTVFTVVATVAAAEAAAVAAAPAAASVSEEKNSWTLNIIRFLVFVTLFLHRGIGTANSFA